MKKKFTTIRVSTAGLNLMSIVKFKTKFKSKFMTFKSNKLDFSKDDKCFYFNKQLK